MFKITLKRLQSSCFLTGLFASAIASPSLAENPVFGKVSLAPGFQPASGVVSGYTSGSASLPAIVANSDRLGNKCLGFADTAPDYIMVLQKDFARLRLQIDSGGKDTTLAVKGPNGVVRCGDDTGKNKDASIDDSDWKAGDYSIWVGTIEPGPRLDYKLSVQQ